MPRGSNHLDDDEITRSLYREFDLEDLIRIINWMRDISKKTFTIKQACALSGLYTGGAVSILYMSGGQWGAQRVRRVLRVGVELRWLQDNGRARSFTIVEGDTSVLPVSLKAATKLAQLDRFLVDDLWCCRARQVFEENGR